MTNLLAGPVPTSPAHGDRPNAKRRVSRTASWTLSAAPSRRWRRNRSVQCAGISLGLGFVCSAILSYTIYGILVWRRDGILV